MEAATKFENTFKDFEYQGWEVSVNGYNEGFTPLTRKCIPAVLKSLDVKSGESFLDVATGLGYLAIEANKLGANTTAIDFSPEMIEGAKVIEPDIEFKVDDAEALSFSDNSFDKVAMAFGILHLENPEAALREAYRVLKPGGKYAFVIWVSPEQGSPGFSTMMEAVKTKGDLSVSLPEGPAFFHYSAPEVSIASLLEAGFTDIESETVEMTWSLPNGKAFFNAFYLGTARTGGLLRAQSSDKLSEVQQEAERLVTERFSTGTGLEIPMNCVIFSGKKV